MMWTLGPLSHPAGVDGAACVLCSWTGAEHGHSTSLLGHPLMFAALPGRQGCSGAACCRENGPCSQVRQDSAAGCSVVTTAGCITQVPGL